MNETQDQFGYQDYSSDLIREMGKKPLATSITMLFISLLLGIIIQIIPGIGCLNLAWQAFFIFLVTIACIVIWFVWVRKNINSHLKQDVAKSKWAALIFVVISIVVFLIPLCLTDVSTNQEKVIKSRDIRLNTESFLRRVRFKWIKDKPRFVLYFREYKGINQGSVYRIDKESKKREDPDGVMKNAKRKSSYKYWRYEILWDGKFNIYELSPDDHLALGIEAKRGDPIKLDKKEFSNAEPKLIKRKRSIDKAEILKTICSSYYDTLATLCGVLTKDQEGKYKLKDEKPTDFESDFVNVTERIRSIICNKDIWTKKYVIDSLVYRHDGEQLHILKPDIPREVYDTLFDMTTLSTVVRDSVASIVTSLRNISDGLYFVVDGSDVLSFNSIQRAILDVPEPVQTESHHSFRTVIISDSLYSAAKDLYVISRSIEQYDFNSRENINQVKSFALWSSFFFGVLIMLSHLIIFRIGRMHALDIMSRSRYLRDEAINTYRDLLLKHSRYAYFSIIQLFCLLGMTARMLDPEQALEGSNLADQLLRPFSPTYYADAAIRTTIETFKFDGKIMLEGPLKISLDGNPEVGVRLNSQLENALIQGRGTEIVINQESGTEPGEHKEGVTITAQGNINIDRATVQSQKPIEVHGFTIQIQGGKKWEDLADKIAATGLEVHVLNKVDSTKKKIPLETNEITKPKKLRY